MVSKAIAYSELQALSAMFAARFDAAVYMQVARWRSCCCRCLDMM